MLGTPIALQALNDKDLYISVIEHRRTFIGLKGFDYSTLLPQTLNFIPPDDILSLWRQDYRLMQESMIYGDSLPFNQMIDKLHQLNEEINRMKY